MFLNSPTGRLTAIHGHDALYGEWSDHAFVPHPLPRDTPSLDVRTFNAVSEARAALASLDSTARQLPNPALLRLPTLRLEAQSTSALEGTYAPLREVLVADEEQPPTLALREILNYVAAAEHAFAWVVDGRPLTMGLACELHRILVRGTPAETQDAGRVREIQVVIGADPSAPIDRARFVPRPPGPELVQQLRDNLDWMSADHGGDIDPAVAAALAHYQFETLHPFNDGNGRIGRLLIVLHLLRTGVLTEPTLTVSPWFEARRGEYYDHLLAISARGDWDPWVRFFAEGLAASAESTETQMRALVGVWDGLKETIRHSGLRADSAYALVEFAVANPSFTVRNVQEGLRLSYGRANTLVGQLEDLSVLAQQGDASYNRRYYAPAVLDVLIRSAGSP
jgi:Fic family protein